MLFLVIVAAVLGGQALIAHLLNHLPSRTHEVTPRKIIISELLMIFAGLVATIVMSRIDKRPGSTTGCVRRNAPDSSDRD